MIKELAGAIWRRTPVTLKRWTMSISHARFSVTAGAIITDDRGRVLLLKHRFRPGSGWGMPGGYIEAGEQPDDALRRELGEEIGLKLDKVELFLTRAFKKPRQIEIIFRCQAMGNPARLNYEIEKAEWFSPSAMPRELPKDQVELIGRAFADGAKQPD
jgi:8-oxo-dGTP pyrophosphatase MutT (NUDIX family)